MNAELMVNVHLQGGGGAGGGEGAAMSFPNSFKIPILERICRPGKKT